MITVESIAARLPHRYPMLLVDSVSEIEISQGLVAHKAITANEPWYAGLEESAQPSDWMYPQSLLLESWCQAASLLATWEAPNPSVAEGRVMLFGGMSSVLFEEPVMPGCVLEHRVRVQRALPDTLLVEGECMTGAKLVLSVGSVVLALRPAAELRPTDAKPRLANAEIRREP